MSCAKRQRRCAPNLRDWYITDYQWPDDHAVMQGNHIALRELGAVVAEESVDAMNVGAFLQTQGINADHVVLALINGLCCRTGTNSTEYRDTQHTLDIPGGYGPPSCGFAALCAALPQATVVVSVTGADKHRICEKVQVRHASTRRVLCRRLLYPDAVRGVQYKPQSNGLGGGDMADTVPLALVAVGPSLDDEACFGQIKQRTLDMGNLGHAATIAGGVVLFLGEFSCTSSLHLAYFCVDNMPPQVPRPMIITFPKEVMRWGVAEYDYDETVRHCMKKLQDKGMNVRHVGMHAAALWLGQGLHITHFRAGDEYRLVAVVVRNRSRLSGWLHAVL
jgi:hypothetical protein